ncbi:hypothetical protein DL768_011197 [Monosporascus sp. mg162]|nr:hypothetical protein DL768_011197 [Monosporascus sp. mg162]
MSDDPIPKDVILKDRFTYPNWFLSLRFNALSRGVWHLIDPDAPDVDRSTGPRKLPTLEEYTEEANDRLRKQHTEALAAWQDIHDNPDQRGPAPQAPKELKAADLKEQYETDLRRLAEDIREESREASKIDAKYTNIQTWISATVESQILRNAQATLVIQGKTTIQNLLRELRDQLAPSDLSTITTVREEYRKALRLAEVGHMKPDQWYRTWFSAYTQAKAYDLQEIKGPLAAKDFLSAVAKRLAPDWGQRELSNLIRDDSLGRPTITLKELGAWFSAMCHENKLRAETKDPGIFATLTQGSPSESGSSPHPGENSSSPRVPRNRGNGNKCPCLATLDKTHRWEPTDCAVLRFVITGVTTRRIRHVSPEEQEGIRERFKQSRWKKLRDNLQKLPEWKESVREVMRRSAPNTNTNTQFGNITAALIDPHTLDALDPTPGIYTTIHFGKHPLSQSTLIDNCGARHLVNTRDLLVPGSFVPDSTGETVEAGTSSIPISGKGQRVIKRVLLGASGKPEHDLILNDVVVVDGFHVNIVSEALLRRAGIWYCGRTPESRAPRPFWRILWDYFDYPLGYDGSRWLLVIKDEYSGKLFAFPTADRTKETAFRIIRDFEHWVRRQYRLPICKIKQDNDTGTIAINGFTAYQAWCTEEGIELETPPPYTKEPVGGSERAGQELINKALKMRLGANLPKDLWPEAVKAAAWLHNMSPSHAHDLLSPNEVLARWFRQYFRWYDPAIVNAITADLRPDWSGIFAYGARAYPLTRDREAGRKRRAQKVEPRAHIGYLVGYRASNIYRIWVPELRQVITTRNVTFDEDIFYQPEKEKEEALAPAISRGLAKELYISEDLAEKDPVFDMLDAWDSLHTDHSTLKTAESSASDEDLTGGQPEGQNSGVRELLGKAGVDRGLLTPEDTPDPENEEPSGDQQDPAPRAPKPKKSKGKQPQAPTRRSERLRKRENSDDTEDGGARSVNATVIYGSSEICLALDRNWEEVTYLFPLLQHAAEQGHEELYTFHAVIAAGALQKNAERLGAAPNRAKIHRDQLEAKPPKHWKDLEKHPLGEAFKEDARREIYALMERGHICCHARG